MGSPADCRFLESHEWHRYDGSLVTLGISRFAVDELTDVTFVELPAVGETIETGQPIGEIESVKATADLYSGVSGVVKQVNEQVSDDPGLLNREPFESGWLIKIEPTDPGQLESLMDQPTYDQKYPTDE